MSLPASPSPSATAAGAVSYGTKATWRDLKHPAVLLATWGGSGLSPKAPGTIGSLAAMPILLPVLWHFGLTALWIVTGLLLLVGLWASHVYMHKFQRHDPGEVVIDEVVGMGIAMAGITPVGDGLVSYLLAFALFRLFDIWKPWPICWADRKLPGTWGVMLDDVIAGVYAWLLVTPVLMVLVFPLAWLSHIFS